MIIFFSQRLLFVFAASIVAYNSLAQQNSLQANENVIIFSAVKGTVSKPISIPYYSKKGEKINVLIAGEKSGYFNLVSPAPKQVPAGKEVSLILEFTPANDFIGSSKAKLQIMNSAGKLLRETELRGLSLKGLEGENEPALKTVLDVLGYQINNGWSS